MSNSDRDAGDFEAIRAAEKLVEARGVSTAAYVAMKIKEEEETGDEGNQTYWEKILEEVEKLLYED